MARYRVSISGFQGSYTERWEADSADEAERKARQRWQRTFGDAGSFRFHAKPESGRRPYDTLNDPDNETGVWDE